MGAFTHIERCFELAEEDIASAVESREQTLALLRRMAEISEPNGGAAKSLLVFARMATTACEWLDGDLRVEIGAGRDRCVVEGGGEAGVGLPQRGAPALRL